MMSLVVLCFFAWSYTVQRGGLPWQSVFDIAHVASGDCDRLMRRAQYSPRQLYCKEAYLQPILFRYRPKEKKVK